MDSEYKIYTRQTVLNSMITEWIEILPSFFCTECHRAIFRLDSGVQTLPIYEAVNGLKYAPCKNEQKRPEIQALNYPK